MANELILLSCWSSPFGVRVRIALEEKEIEYEYREEDLGNKSDLLKKTNPICQRVPVLIHNGKPLTESLVQLQYIDDVWKENYPLLPSDPYLKAQALFWGNFIDNKVYEGGRTAWHAKGEQHDAAKKEYRNALKVLEAEIGDKTYFFGDRFGYVDIVFVPIYSWLPVFGGDINMEKEFPKVSAWMKRCLERKSVSKHVPHPQKILDFIPTLERILGLK